MEINVVRVEPDRNTVVDTLVAQLVALEPATYSVGKDAASEVNKMRAALYDAGFRSVAKKIGVGGTRIATKGKHAGEEVDVIHYDLRVNVTAPAGQPEPPLPKRETKANKQVDVPDEDQDVDPYEES